MSKSTNKREFLGFRLTKDESVALERAAWQTKQTKSKIGRLALRFYLNHLGLWPPAGEETDGNEKS